jgi:hypothetical protein
MISPVVPPAKGKRRFGSTGDFGRIFMNGCIVPGTTETVVA